MLTVESMFGEVTPKPKADGKKTNPRAGKSKAKGNKFENDMAKQLSQWMFGEIDFLQRSLTSGAVKRKTLYLGDIVPAKNLPWKDFPFFLELKHGYKQFNADFINTTIIDKWLLKCLEQRTKQQPIIYLIVRFHNREIILITDLELIIRSKIIIREEYNGEFIPFFIYKLKDITNYDFYDLYRQYPKLLDVLTH
jgi:hypothetical protein